MQAITNKLLPQGKAWWPPPVKSVLREGVILCIAMGIPIAALLYNSQLKGKGYQSRKERERLAGIIRAMLKAEKGKEESGSSHSVTCKRIWSMLKAAKEEGEDSEKIKEWQDEFFGSRVSIALTNAVEKGDEKAVASLVKLLDDDNRRNWKYIPKKLNKKINRLLRTGFYKRLKTVAGLILGPARFQIKWILLNVLAAVASGVIRSLNLRYYLKAQEAARLGKGGTELVQGILATLVIYILDVLMEVLRQQSSNRGAGEIQVQLQRQLFAKLLTADCAFHDVSYKHADKMTLLREAGQLDQKLLRLPVDLATLVASVGARYYALGKMSTRLLVAVGIFVPISSWLATKAQLWVTQQREALRHSTERRRNYDARILGSQLLTVRSFVQERIEAEQFERFLRNKVREDSKACVLDAFSKLVSLLPLLVRLGGLIYGSQLVSKGWLTPLQLEEFVTAHDIAMADLGSLKDTIPALWAAMEPAARIVEVINAQNKIEPALNTGIKEPSWVTSNKDGDYPPLSIEFKDVWFSYPNRPDVTVLRGVSFKIEAGTKVAVVGPSGSGKSTILALIQRFYEPKKGVILIDGHDIREYDPRWLRRLIAVVSQRCVVFTRDVISNISLSNRDDEEEEEKGDGKMTKSKTEKKEKKEGAFKLLVSKPRRSDSNDSEGVHPNVPRSIIAAANTANAAKFIEKLPEGYHTQLGEGGIELSGGQQQRIAIARAIEKKPALLLLDEAFANLDASSEANVLESLKALIEARPKTVVTVAHQLSTIAWSDVIICMDHGIVREVGSHKELMKKEGIYHQLYTAQKNSVAVVDHDGEDSKKSYDDDEEDELGLPLPDLNLVRAMTLPQLRRHRSDVLSLCGES